MTGAAFEVNKSPAGTSQCSISSTIILIANQILEALSYFTENIGKISIARKTGLEANSCRTLQLVPGHQLLGRALQCLK